MLEEFGKKIKQIKRLPKYAVLALLLGHGKLEAQTSDTHVQLGDGTSIEVTQSEVTFFGMYIEQIRSDTKKLIEQKVSIQAKTKEYVDVQSLYASSKSDIEEAVLKAGNFFKGTKKQEDAEKELSSFTLKKAESEMKDFFESYERQNEKSGKKLSAEEATKLFRKYLSISAGVENLERAYSVIEQCLRDGPVAEAKLEKKNKGPQQDGAIEWSTTHDIDTFVGLYFKMLVLKEELETAGIESDMLESTIDFMKQTLRDGGIEIIGEQSLAEKE